MSELAERRKRAFNPSLSEHLVEEARAYGSNLSATVDTLLADYIAQQHRARANRQQRADTCTAGWNAVHDKVGSFADEHSTL